MGETVKSGSVNKFQSTGISDRATSKKTGSLHTPKICNAPGFEKAKCVK